jgi:phage terminase large subunit-like protein
MSPLWSWEVGNVKIEESREGNRKILKSGVNSKVDNIHALVDALYCFDLSEGKMGG